MTRQQWRSARKRFERFAGKMLGSLGHVKQRHWSGQYVHGLLLEGPRKAFDPLARYLGAPDGQAFQQVISTSPWAWEPVREAVGKSLRRALGKGGAWIVDDTSFPKRGDHSVGVARQYCGALGKTANCQDAVSISYATERGAMPLEFALYLPESWAHDGPRRARAGVPTEVRFAPKWELALEVMDTLLARGHPRPEVVVADADYGRAGGFREGLRARRLPYVVQVRGDLAAWESLEAPRARRLLTLARSWPAEAWQEVCWREGAKGPLCSRFGAARVRPRQEEHHRPLPAATAPEVWLLVEWPASEAQPTKYWYSDLPEDTPLERLVEWAKSRWPIEQNYQEMKTHLGLEAFEGRGWVGWHHHVTLVMLAFGFVLLERLGEAKRGARSRPSPRPFTGSSTSSSPGRAPASAAASPLPTARGTILF